MLHAVLQVLFITFGHSVSLLLKLMIIILLASLGIREHYQLLITLPIGMTLLLGSELSSEVDTPVEVDTNSLSISAAAYFAFYCLFLTAFYFWCKLCS